MPDIRVLLVDDHPIVRSGIRNLLDPAPGITVIAEAPNGAEALQKIKDLKPDVVLLDMKLPDMSGIEVIKQIYESKSSARVLGLSSYDDRQYISQLLNYGASGYLLKEKEGGTELTSRELEVLRLVVEGKTNDQIGMSLGISVKTVENHLHAIFRKMGVISRVEAAVMAVRESLIR